MAVFRLDLDRDVFPPLFDRLAEAFPDFGWRKKGQSWVATNATHTRTLSGKPRPNRVEAFDNTPFGFTIHGGEFVSWLQYLQERYHKSGWEAVRTLAELAGVPVPESGEASAEYVKAQAKAELREVVWETFVARARSFLMDDAGAAARGYLAERGFSSEKLEKLEFGLYPDQGTVADWLRPVAAEGATFGLQDGRWAGRIVHPWRDHRGRIATIWARATDASEPKYLYLSGKSGATKPGLFGLWKASRSREGRKNLIVLEGVMDVLALRAGGLPNAAATGGGGAQISSKDWEDLARLGIRKVTLLFDNDPKDDGTWPGRDGTLRAVAKAQASANVPAVYVVDPALLGEHKDPDALVRAEGIPAFRAVLEKAIHAYRYRARTIVEAHRPPGGWTDDAIGSVLEEARSFSARCPKAAAAELASFFWPAIREATGAPIEALQAGAEAIRKERDKERERRDLDRLVQKAQDALASGRIEDAKALLGEETPRLLARSRGLKAEPLLPVCDELEAHEEKLQKWRGRDFIGLTQGTIRKLDEATLGLRGLMLLAAAPNVGKTALAVQLGVDVVRHNPDACFLFLSLEMSRWDILSRIKCRLAGMDWKTLIFGSQKGRGRGRDVAFTGDELERLCRAERELDELGERICILDESNFPAPTVEKVLAALADLKARTRTERALLLVDYLQVWPIPEHEAPTVRTELDADKWRIGQMKTLRDAAGGDAILVISEARKPSGGQAPEAWGTDLSDVMGAARGTYTPDMVFLFRPFTDKELEATYKGETTHGMKSLKDKLAEAGKTHVKLWIAKGRDGVLRGTIPLTFWYCRAFFEPGTNKTHGPKDSGVLWQ